MVLGRTLLNSKISYKLDNPSGWLVGKFNYERRLSQSKALPVIIFGDQNSWSTWR